MGLSYEAMTPKFSSPAGAMVAELTVVLASWKGRVWGGKTNPQAFFGHAAFLSYS